MKTDDFCSGPPANRSKRSKASCTKSYSTMIRNRLGANGFLMTSISRSQMAKHSADVPFWVSTSWTLTFRNSTHGMRQRFPTTVSSQNRHHHCRKLRLNLCRAPEEYFHKTSKRLP